MRAHPNTPDTSNSAAAHRQDADAACGSRACAPCTPGPAPNRTAAAPHDHSTPGAPHAHSQSHSHSHSHAPGAHGAHDAENDHDHGALPGLPRIVAALLVALAAELIEFLVPDTRAWTVAGMALAAVAIGLSGLGIYMSGLRALRRGKLGIDTLMAVAVTGAFLIGQWPEAAMVMALYALAELIEHKAADRARNAIAGLMALAPDQADVLDADGQWRRQRAAEVALNATMRVRPGERVPLDGIILEGHSALDQASVTGESIPVDKGPGDAVFAGTVNQGGELRVRVTAAAGQSTLDRIIEAVETAQASRAPTQRFVERFAAVYTPAVFVLALALALIAPWALGWSWLDAIYKALVLLVIACPCALVISTPVTVVSGLTAAARRGVLIKGGTHLENARHLRAVALDKTGTITEGQPRLVHWQVWNEADADTAERAASSLAARSDHPVSRAIAQGLSAAPQEVEGFNAIVGYGSEGRVSLQGLTRPWALGNHRLAEERGLCSPALEAALAAHEQQGRTVTLLMDDSGVRALFAVADTIRPHARQAMAALQAVGLTPVMLSGDNPSTVQAVAREAGIADARGGLLPQDKLRAIEELQQRYGPTAMTGDGINDAPALARADLGFAMGAVGTDIAMEAADVVIMNDDLGRIADTVRLSRRTHRVLWQNITLALGIKAVFFVLAVFGSATMWMAVFADMGASLLVVANGLRLLRMR